MRHGRKWLASLLAAVMVLSTLATSALAAEGAETTSAAEPEAKEVTVTTSDEFRAALTNDAVKHIIFKGKLTVEAKAGDNALYAGNKAITPADPTSDEDNLIFAEGVTLLHVSAHEGNKENPDSQSIPMIYGRNYDGKGAEPDYTLLAQAAEGWVGWYEYHDKGASTEDDPYAGMRVCYIQYCGRWQDAVKTAEDLTAGGWKHPAVKSGDDNQIIFFQFGKARTVNRDIILSKDVTVTGWTQVMGGQSMVVQSGATLTTAGLTLETMGEREWGFLDVNSSNLTVKDGGKVVIHKPEGSYVNSPYLGAEGRVTIENLATGLTYDSKAEIWCEYHPLYLAAQEPAWDAVKGQCGDSQTGFASSFNMVQGTTREGWFCGTQFQRRDEHNNAAGWFCDGESAETCLVVGADGKATEGLTVAQGQDGKVVFTANATGSYKVYLYHNPKDPDVKKMWGDWIPYGIGSDIPGTEGLPITVTVTEKTVPNFTDVPNDAYFAAPVKWAVEQGITVGTSDTTFSPYATCSKAQILTFLWRGSGSPEPTIENPFTDVTESNYFYKAALWASEKGMVTGTEFASSTPCTRAMTVEYMWKAAGSPAPAKAAAFTDVSADAAYADAVAWAVEQGITTGTSDTTFTPANTCTRGQIATFLYRGQAKEG